MCDAALLVRNVCWGAVSFGRALANGRVHPASRLVVGVDVLLALLGRTWG